MGIGRLTVHFVYYQRMRLNEEIEKVLLAKIFFCKFEISYLKNKSNKQVLQMYSNTLLT